MRASLRALLGTIPFCLLTVYPLRARVAQALEPAETRQSDAAADPAAGAVEEEIYEAVAEVEAPPRQATERSIAREELTRVPGTAGDPLKAVDILPGVARSSDGEPILRGAAQHESAVFIDGMSVPVLYHFGGLRSVVHPRLVERVDLFPGNFSPRYGRATGGVVEATLRDPRTDGLHGELELSLLDSSALVEGPLGEGSSFAVAARRSNIDFVFDNFVPEDTFDVVVAPLYWDYQGLFVYTPTEQRRLRVALLGSRDQTTLSFADPSTEDVGLRGNVGGAVEFHRGMIAYDDRSGDVSQRLQVSFGVQSFEQDVGPNSEAYFDVIDLAARGEWDAPLGEQVSLGFGLDTEVSFFEGAYRGPAAPALEGSLDTPNNVQDLITVDRTSFVVLNPAVYVEARYLPVPDLSLLPSVRLDYYQTLDAFTLNPRLSQRYTLTDAVTLKSAVGWYSQPPEYYESIEGVGNPDIDPYHALHVSAGVELAPSEELSLDVEGFFKHLTHRIVATEGSAPPHFINDGQGRVIGLETGAGYHAPGGLSAQLAYTLSRSERQDRERPWRLFDSDQTHVLSVALGYPLGAGFHAGARFRYVTGNPVTRVVGAVYDAGTDVYYPIYGEQNAERDPAFQQLDLRLEKGFDVGSGRLSVYLDVQNVYAADNAEGFTYSYDYRERKATTGSPFFPNLGLRGEL